jgi:SSS family solute:Na+ symporter
VVVVLSLVSLYLAIYSSMTLVSLLLLGYAGVTQFFPGVVFGLFWRRANAAAVLAGMLAGIAAVAFLALTNRDPYHGLNAGFLALCLNFAVTVVLSWLREAILPSKEAPPL